MKGKAILSVYTVCDKETAGAIPLYDEIGDEGKICRYVIKTAYSGEPLISDRYFLGQSDKSGGGDGFGAEGEHFSSYQETQPIHPESLIFDKDGETLLGYAYPGSYDYYSNGDRKRYARDIFLPLGGAARHTDHEYSYTVYPYDGTSSSYKRNKYTQFVSR